MSGEWRKRVGYALDPQWLGSEIPKRGFVPYCSEECRHHDGKRCGLTGQRPSNICEPAVERMSETLDDIEGKLR